MVCLRGLVARVPTTAVLIDKFDVCSHVAVFFNPSPFYFLWVCCCCFLISGLTKDLCMIFSNVFGERFLDWVVVP